MPSSASPVLSAAAVGVSTASRANAQAPTAPVPVFWNVSID
jgi:hypothetical protein